MALEDKCAGLTYYSENMTGQNMTEHQMDHSLTFVDLCWMPIGPQLEKLMEQLRTEMTTNPPLEGSYVPKKGDVCAAQFTDNEWYRAKVQKISGSKIDILYIDYGNVCTYVYR